MDGITQFARWNRFGRLTENQMSVSSIGRINLLLCEQKEDKVARILTEIAFMRQEAGQEHLRMCLEARELSEGRFWYSAS
jgi:hypothetical protein